VATKKRKATPEPVKRMRIPTELRKYGNGRIPDLELHDIIGGGRLWGQAAFWWNVMATEARKNKIDLRAVSEGYRSYARQEALFLQRYSQKPTGRIPQVTRKWNGVTWYLKRGMSPCASPGASPHGWGLAQDIEVPARTYRWMCKNAPFYGFYLQGKSKLPNGKPNPEFEAWHWQFCNAT
jgi:zinc D-Ala-D-Ala carboxypeptidase